MAGKGEKGLRRKVYKGVGRVKGRRGKERKERGGR